MIWDVDGSEMGKFVKFDFTNHVFRPLVTFSIVMWTFREISKWSTAHVFLDNAVFDLV